jgi:hypothetical protein
MNAPLVILVAWFTPGIVGVIFSLWYFQTQEKPLIEETPEFQIFGCIPPRFKWAVLLLFLFFGPVLLLAGLCEAIQQSRTHKAETDIPSGPPAAAPVVSPQSASMVFLGLFGAALSAWIWASAWTARPVATFFRDQAWMVGFFLFHFILGGALAKGRPFRGVRAQLGYVPLYLVNLVPSVVVMAVGWEGGWIPGIAGAAAGATAGAVNGWLYDRWIMPEYDKRRERERAIRRPRSADGPGSSGAMAERS